ncbi:MAG: universal stress protein [Deltaproteobacteria bacterium]|nr:MAG: universal stress protein [Deltaproteobacteria bacterium]
MKIMVGYRGKEAGRELLHLAVKHAKAFDAEILLVTSMRGGESVELEKFDQAEETLENAKEFIEKQGIKVETKFLVRGLNPGEDLVNFSREAKVDAIIIGVKSRSKVGKLVFGSTAQVVILEADCPVLSVK